MLRKIIGFYLNVIGFTSENINSKIGKDGVLNIASTSTNGAQINSTTVRDDNNASTQQPPLDNEDVINEVAEILCNLGDLLEISIQLNKKSKQQRN